MANYVYSAIKLTGSGTLFDQLKERIRKEYEWGGYAQFLGSDNVAWFNLDYDYNETDTSILFYLISKWTPPYDQVIQIARDCILKAEMVYADETAFREHPLYHSLEFPIETMEDGDYITDLHVGGAAAVVISSIMTTDGVIDDAKAYPPVDGRDYVTYYHTAMANEGFDFDRLFAALAEGKQAYESAEEGYIDEKYYPYYVEF